MSTGKIRILLVDDEAYFCHQVAGALKRPCRSLDFVLDAACSLAEGLERLRKYSYDLVLLDLGLPESEGLKTFDIVHRTYPNMPVVILTRLDDEDTGIEAITKGASDYLVKGSKSLREVLVRSIVYALERKRGEERLRQSESNFRNLVNKNPDAILVTDKKGRILFANAGAETLFARKAEELRGEALGPSVVGRENTEVLVVRKGGGKAVVQTRAIETKWQGDDCYLVLLRDLTQHRSAENRLKKYRENLRSLIKERKDKTDAEKELLSVTFSSVGEGVVVVDGEKRILLFNEVAEQLAGWEFELVQNKRIDALFHIVDERTREGVENPIDKVLRSGEIESGGELDLLVGLDGSEHPISTIAAPLRVKSDIIGVVMVFRDVSREREVERMKRDFISSISHELRTPLTSILAYTETILHDGGMPAATRREFLEIIEEEGKRLAELIEGLLEISRLDSGEVKLLREAVDIAAVVRRVCSALQPLAAKKDIRLATDVSGEVGALAGDEGKIESVVTNLVNNAIKFTPEGGRVSVSVCKEGEAVVMRVSDTGVGIPKEVQKKIFDPFYRAADSGAEIQGTGLGLAIVERIVALHEGRIQMESEVNEGTTFSVFLPAASNPVPASSPANSC